MKTFRLTCGVLFMVAGLVWAEQEGLVAHWDFSEGKGDVLGERSGNDNHGKIHGAKWIKNGARYALEFDGVDDVVDCGGGPSLDLRDQVSMEAWVWFEPRRTQGEAAIIGKDFTSYVMTQYGGIYTYIGGGPYNTRSALSHYEWHHVASTYDGKVIRLYIDGQFANQATLNQKPKPGAHFWMGKSAAESEWTKGARFHGNLTDVRVYNRVLTQEEIVRHFQTTNLTQTVAIQAVPVPWQHRIVADVNVRGLGEQPAGLTVDVTLHKRSRAGRAEGPALSKAVAATFDVTGLASVSLRVPDLGAVEYAVHAKARDAAGKQVGLAGTADVTWTIPRLFPRGPKGARQLNNLVTELLNVSRPDTSGKAHAFTNPRTGWIFISNNAAPEVTLSGQAAGPQKIVLRDKHGQAHEAMRYLPKGNYRISTAGASKLVVRSIPHMVFDSFHSVPKVEEFGPYRGDFQEKYIFKNINTFVGSRRAKEKELKMWKDYGKKWFIHCNVLIDKGKKLVTVQDAYNYLVGRKNINSPYVDGLIADEYGSSTRYCDPCADAVDRFFSEPKYQDKIYVPFAGSLWNGDPGRKLVRAVIKHNGAIAMKSYLKEQRSEAAAWRFMDQYLVERVRGYRENLPGSVPHVLICFGWHLCGPPESTDTFPHVDFKTYIESQLNLVANHPVLENIGGIMTYTAAYADEETIRWSMRIFRHYAIEGKTQMLSDDPYILTHIEDPDFEMHGKGWTLSAAQKDSIRFDTHAGFAHLAQRYPRSSEGTNVIVTRRCANKPNAFSQEIKNLEPGGLYNLRMFSGDFKDLSAKQSHAVSVRIDGAALMPEKCFDAVVANCHRFGPYKKRGAAWVNYYWRVFRATGPTARISVSDWADEKAPGGPIAQELMFNFIEIQPYFDN